MRIDEIVRIGLTRLDVIRVRTVINPLLWLVGLTTPFALVAMLAMPDMRPALLAFAAMPVAFTMVVYLVWMIRDPDRLQSEEYRIKHRVLQILRRRGSGTDVVEVARERPVLKIDRRSREEGEA